MKIHEWSRIMIQLLGKDIFIRSSVVSGKFRITNVMSFVVARLEQLWSVGFLVMGQKKAENRGPVFQSSATVYTATGKVAVERPSVE